MQSRGVAPRVGIAASDIPEWDALYRSPGPFVSVYFDTTVHDANTPKQLQVAWEDAADLLHDLGAPNHAVELAGHVLVDAHLRTDAVAVVADQDRVVLARDLDAPIARSRVAFGATPLLTPLIEWQQSLEPHVVVVVDHIGADIVVFDPKQGTISDTTSDPDPTDRELHHSQPGGWSQPRYQRRAKRRWRTNAGEAADRLTRIVREVHPRIVAVAGDVRSVHMLTEQLPATVREIVHEIRGTRARDGGGARQRHDLARLVQDAVDEDTRALVDKFREELGQRDRAVAGASATLEALSEARVDTLLVHDDADDPRMAWFATDSHVVAFDEESVRASGTQRVAQSRLVDVAVRAALITGASVRVMPPIRSLSEGLGAILRH